MELQIGRWGNSLGIRIPKRIKEILELQKGSWVTATLQSGKIIIEPLKHEKSMNEKGEKIDLKKLTSKIKTSNKPELEEDTPIGKELW